VILDESPFTGNDFFSLYNFYHIVGDIFSPWLEMSQWFPDPIGPKNLKLGAYGSVLEKNKFVTPNRKK
jgi:hypothetical protein